VSRKSKQAQPKKGGLNEERRNFSSRSIPATEFYDILGNKRRAKLIRVINSKGSLKVSELSRRIASLEENVETTEVSDNKTLSVMASLSKAGLEKLEEIDVIEVDEAGNEGKDVFPGTNFNQAVNNLGLSQKNHVPPELDLRDDSKETISSVERNSLLSNARRSAIIEFLKRKESGQTSEPELIEMISNFDNTTIYNARASLKQSNLPKLEEKKVITKEDGQILRGENFEPLANHSTLGRINLGSTNFQSEFREKIYSLLDEEEQALPLLNIESYLADLADQIDYGDFYTEDWDDLIGLITERNKGEIISSFADQIDYGEFYTEDWDGLIRNMLERSEEVTIEQILENPSVEEAEELSDAGVLNEFHGRYFATENLLEIADEEEIDFVYGNYLRELVKDILEINARVANSRKIEGIRKDYDSFTDTPGEDSMKVTNALQDLAEIHGLDFEEWLWNENSPYRWNLSKMRDEYEELLKNYAKGLILETERINPAGVPYNSSKREIVYNPSELSEEIKKILPNSEIDLLEEIEYSESGKALLELNQEFDRYAFVEVNRTEDGEIIIDDYLDRDLILQDDVPLGVNYALVEITGWSFWDYPAKKAEYRADLTEKIG
jgi:hypothetical protein